MVLGEDLYDLEARGRLDVVREERLVAKLFDRDGITLRKRVLRLHDQHQLVPENGEGFKVTVNRLKSKQGEIHIAIQDFERQTLRHMPVDFDLHIRMLLSIIQDEVRQEIKRGALVSADADATALQPHLILDYREQHPNVKVEI